MKYINLKTISGFAIAITLLITLNACDSNLDVTPTSSVSPEIYLNNESHLAAYTINYYDALFPTSRGSGGQFFYHNDLETDNETSRAGNARYRADGAWTVGATGGSWSFGNIYAMNFFIRTVRPRIEQNKITGNSANIKHYFGEAYFLRSLDYFNRLVALGDFPIIITVQPANYDILVKASERRPRNEVARFILASLDSAITNLSNTPPGGKVRITKNTALLLKARVALFEATWEKYHAGTPLVPNGTDWPGKTKEYLKNYAYNATTEINFFLDQAMDASKQVAEASALVLNNKVMQQAASDAKNQYYDMFASANPIAYSEVLMTRLYDITLGNNSSLNHFGHSGGGKGYTKQFEKTFLMQNGLPIYDPASGYAGDDYIGNTKTNRDWRWILFMKAPGEVASFLNIVTPDKFANPAIVYSTDIKASTATGYIKGKGYSFDYNNVLLEKDVTAPVLFRAAEAYLTYIEASYLRNGTIDGTADKYWKALRTRAGVDPDYSKTIAATDMSKEAENDWGAYSHGVLVTSTLYNIRRERRCEMISEGQRYHDLLRWRAMDQLNGFQLEGSKIFGPMKDQYSPTLFRYDQAVESKNTVSSPTLSLYFRPFQIMQSNNSYYNGFYFCNAHYLSPIAAEHFLISSSDRTDPANASIYQNPGWGFTAGSSADRKTY